MTTISEYEALAEALAKRLYHHYRQSISRYGLENRPPSWEFLTDRKRNAWFMAVKTTLAEMNWLIGKEFSEDPA